jgi:hypothetical protein
MTFGGEVGNVESDLKPGLDSVDLKLVGWDTGRQDNVTSAELGGQGSLERS